MIKEEVKSIQEGVKKIEDMKNTVKQIKDLEEYGH